MNALWIRSGLKIVVLVEPKSNLDRRLQGDSCQGFVTVVRRNQYRDGHYRRANCYFYTPSNCDRIVESVILNVIIRETIIIIHFLNPPRNLKFQRKIGTGL